MLLEQSTQPTSRPPAVGQLLSQRIIPAISHSSTEDSLNRCLRSRSRRAVTIGRSEAIDLRGTSTRKTVKPVKLKSIKVNRFRRFEDLQIDDLPPAKLVVLAGPNGIGKSSLFDAFSTWYQANQIGLSWEPGYHSRSNEAWNQHVQIAFHAGTPSRKTFYFRSAYRNDPEFQINSLTRLAVPTEEIRVRRMIDADGTVSSNYQRLASNAFENAFASFSGSMTLQEFREPAIGEISRAVARLFPDLKLHTLGNPLQDVKSGTSTYDELKKDIFGQ